MQGVKKRGAVNLEGEELGKITAVIHEYGMTISTKNNYNNNTARPFMAACASEGIKRGLQALAQLLRLFL